MRLPSDQHARVSRSLVLRAALGAVLAALTISPIADAAASAKGDRSVFVSKGVGRQIFTGGGGVSYGVVFSGASLVVADYSAAHDMHVDSPVLPTINADGTRTYVPAGRHQEHRFPHLGHALPRDRHRRQHVQRRGRLRPPAGSGQGRADLNGVRSRWNGPNSIVARPPRDVRKLFQLALSRCAAAGDRRPRPTTVPHHDGHDVRQLSAGPVRAQCLARVSP